MTNSDAPRRSPTELADLLHRLNPRAPRNLLGSQAATLAAVRDAQSAVLTAIAPGRPLTRDQWDDVKARLDQAGAAVVDLHEQDPAIPEEQRAFARESLARLSTLLEARRPAGDA